MNIRLGLRPDKGDEGKPRDLAIGKYGGKRTFA
jgi:hypothetical protein